MALVCEVPQLDASLPLFPNARQRWQVALRQRPDATEEHAQQLLVAAFQAWLSLFSPGRVGTPEISVMQEGVPFGTVAGAAPISTAPDELATPDPARFALVEFDLLGGNETMPWPSFSQQRRARRHPLCPLPPLAAFPLAVYPPEALEGSIVLPPADRGVRPDFDLGLPQLPPNPLAALQSSITTAALIGGALFLGYHLLRQQR